MILDFGSEKSRGTLIFSLRHTGHIANFSIIILSQWTTLIPFFLKSSTQMLKKKPNFKIFYGGVFEKCHFKVLLYLSKKFAVLTACLKEFSTNQRNVANRFCWKFYHMLLMWLEPKNFLREGPKVQGGSVQSGPKSQWRVFFFTILTIVNNILCLHNLQQTWSERWFESKKKKKGSHPLLHHLLGTLFFFFYRKSS